MFSCRRTPRLPRCVSLARCGWMISVPVWPNFSALSEVRYDYIKVARDLFIMLRQTPEGRNLFTMLLQLMNRYCQGVIVEGVETLEEWRDVQNSPAAAAQGYFLSRPVPMDTLEKVITTL